MSLNTNKNYIFAAQYNITMATYKKRGYKPKTKGEKDQNLSDGSTTAEVFNTLDETASKTEAWVAKNQKYIFVIVGLAAVFVLGYLGYKEFIAKPQQATAANDMFQAKKYFNEAAEIEYRLFGLFLQVGDKDVSFLHLKNALAIDFEFSEVMKELYPGFFKLDEVKAIISDFKKE